MGECMVALPHLLSCAKKPSPRAVEPTQNRLPQLACPQDQAISGTFQVRTTHLGVDTAPARSQLSVSLPAPEFRPRFTLDAADINATLASNAFGTPVDVTLSHSAGFFTLGAEGEVARHATLGAFGRAWGKSYGGGVNLAVKDPWGNHHKIELGRFTHHAVNDLGPCKAPVPNAASRRSLELRQSTVTGLGLMSNLPPTAPVCAALRLDLSRGRDVVYRTHRPTAEARLLLATPKKNHSSVIAPLNQPDKLLPDDRLTLQVCGTVYGAMAVGIVGACAGVQALVRGDFEISIHRAPDDNRIDMMVTPTQVSGVRLFGTVAGGAQLSYGRYNTSILRQCFSFDMDTPAGRQGYLDALTGKLPCRLHDVPAGGASMGTDLLWAQLVRRENALLPAGVRRLCVQKIDSQQVRNSCGLRLYCLPGVGRQSGPVIAWGRGSSNGHEVETCTEGQRVLSRIVDAHETLHEHPFDGTYSTRVCATQNFVTEVPVNGPAQRVFRGVTGYVRFTADRITCGKMSKIFANEARQAFKLPFATYARARDCRDRGRVITFRRTFDPQAMTRLASIGGAAQRGQAHRFYIMGFAQPLRASLLKLLHDLAHDSGMVDEDARLRGWAEQTNNFLHAQGILGLAALHRLLGSDPTQLHVATHSALYKDAIQQASTLALLHKPLHSDMSVKQVRALFAAAEKALQQLQTAKTIAQEDPWLKPAKRRRLVRALRRAEKQVRGMLVVSRLNAGSLLRMVTQLTHALWLSSADKRIVAYLSPSPSRPHIRRDFGPAFVGIYLRQRQRLQAHMALLRQDVLRDERRRTRDRQACREWLRMLDIWLEMGANNAQTRHLWLDALGWFYWLRPTRWWLRRTILNEAKPGARRRL